MGQIRTLGHLLKKIMQKHPSLKILEQDTRTHSNLTGISDENMVFLAQDEQELYTLQQLQIQSGESFE